MRTHTKETQATVTPAKALAFLREGNERFTNNLRAHRDLLEQVNQTSEGQFPFAVILSCIDSRTSTELIFDQGLGDVFSVRLAGNVVNDDVLGSMEFACRYAGSKLVVILGHTACGAIKGACDDVQLGHLSTLLNKIQPAVYHEQETKENRTSSNTTFVRNVTDLQVRRSVEMVIENSVVLRSMIEAGEVGLIGARYSVEDGSVEFFDDTYMCGEVKHVFLDFPVAARG
ncbi:carbonic anhydrase family protein [Enhygromyxa salina]|uniref:Carbonic anhydrase 2 n=1 Tax=Enhygromyxa salina TaxID=215803 RepID=A0A2S9YNR7_9BACT|nr:carbonic anhydrase family protein [Enhygromyxa salina]PRQ06728.1 Carbonic anhydrase 2 [Enhygromyxa salina]